MWRFVQFDNAFRQIALSELIYKNQFSAHQE